MENNLENDILNILGGGPAERIEPSKDEFIEAIVESHDPTSPIAKAYEKLPGGNVTSESCEEKPDEMLELMLAVLDKALVEIQAGNDRFSIERFNGYQRAILMEMFKNYIARKHSILIAPTGSGKSLIGLLFTHVISQVTQGRSTILASDTFLQNQYIESDNFFTKHVKDASFAMLKGKSNYRCDANFQPYTQGVCEMRRVKPEVAAETMPCAANCGYVQSYLGAKEAQIRVYNYHLWLSYANFVGSHHALLKGDVVKVFDECHKVDDIMDGFANVKIGLQFMKALDNAIASIDLMLNTISQPFQEHIKDAKIQYAEVYRMVLTGNIPVADIQAQFMKAMQVVTTFYNNNHIIEELIIEVSEQYSKEIRKGVELPFTISALFEYETFVTKCSMMYYDCKNISADKFVVNYDAGDNSLTIANISTADRFQNLFKDKLSCPIVFMSATVGNAEYFITYMGLKPEDVGIIDVDSLFDFSRSPIIATQPLLSMNPANKDANLPELVKYVVQIMKAHHSHNGVIHTANKSIARYLWDNLPPEQRSRIITYSNAAEKRTAVETLTPTSNKVIIAYSMEEGVDLKDDLCRFQIITKLSWAYLGDYVIKRKADVYPEWYVMSTLNKILQTFGRGNRHIDDYCINYVTDTSFTRVLGGMDSVTKSRFKDIFYDNITEEFVQNTFNPPAI
ncbi:DNA helicase [Chryseobacterium phage MA9V-2]|nr:DNA helicase [Chryseobacterium phage MA9V-2]